jgi:hypothetical protein
MKLAPIAIGLFATASLASPVFARGTLHLLQPAKFASVDTQVRINDVPVHRVVKVRGLGRAQHHHSVARGAH